MKVVIDTNVMLVSINPGSRFNAVFRQAISGHFHLCISNAILLEYEEIFKSRINLKMAEFAIAALISSPFVLRYDPRLSWKLIKADPDDDKFSDCAITASADYLVTNDRHFDILKQTPFPKLQIISADSFLEIITTEMLSTTNF